MALIEEALVARLAAVSGVTDLVGSRIYPRNLPQSGTYPAISYYRISGYHEQSHGGISGLAMPRFQIDCWSTQYSEAKAVAEQVRLALMGYRGTVSGVRIQGCFLELDQDLYDDETELYRVSQDWFIHHSEATS